MNRMLRRLEERQSGSTNDLPHRTSWSVRANTRQVALAGLIALLAPIEKSRAQTSTTSFPELPAGSASAWVDSLAAEPAPQYEFASDGSGGWAAPNEEQRMLVRSGAGGMVVEAFDPAASATGPLTISLTGFGRKNSLVQVGAGISAAAGPVLSVVRSGVIEWVVNAPEGIKHGFTLSGAPALGSEPVVLEFLITGGYRPFISDERTDVLFRDLEGAPYLWYGGLAAFDAGARPIQASFTVGQGRLRIEIDDTAAFYPITIDPLAVNPRWTTQSNQADSQFGFSVSGPGILDSGNTFPDFLVGAPNFDTDTDDGYAEEGQVIAFRKTNLASPNFSSFWFAREASGQAGARFGQVVRVADFDGDGADDDVVVGAPGFDVGSAQDHGRVIVHYGPLTAGFTDTTPDWRYTGANPGDALGMAIAIVDVDDDGKDDLIVSAPGSKNAGVTEGVLYVWLANSSGVLPLSGSPPDGVLPVQTVPGFSQGRTGFGLVLTNAGDTDGDGREDLLVGAPGYDVDGVADGKGRACVYFSVIGGPLSLSDPWCA